MSAKSRHADFPLGGALDFLRCIWQLNHALERSSQRMERELGVTAQQRFLLRCVGRFPGITPSDVARILHVDPGTISSTLRRLERKHLIERRKDPTDRRRVALGLTEQGRALASPDERTIERAVEKLLLGAEPAAAGTTLALLTQLTQLLTSGELTQLLTSGERRARAHAAPEQDSATTLTSP